MGGLNDRVRERKGPVARRDMYEGCPTTDRIIQLMSIPLVQGSLRYAHKVGIQNLRADDKFFAEGAAFSAAILPRVDACDKAAATTIANNMNIEVGKDNAFKAAGAYEAFKKAFEDTYTCMGITCEDVGGLWGTDDYKEKAAPCGHHDHDHDHDHAAHATTASPTNAATASACVDLKPTLTLMALLGARVALLNHA